MVPFLLHCSVMSLAQRSDAELVEACRGGDLESFRLIVERYEKLVRAASLDACGDPSLSEDVAQETFVAAWTDLDKLRDPRRLKSWLCRIARNRARDARRRRRRERTGSELDDAVADAPSPLDVAANRQRDEVVWRALDDIPESYREPLVLFYREGRSLRQVAALLGLTVATVKQRLSRGRRALRGHLEPALAAAVLAAIAERQASAAAARPSPAAGAASAALPRWLLASAAAVAVGIGALHQLARPDDGGEAAAAEASPRRAQKSLPTLYRPGAEPSVDAAARYRLEGVVLDAFDNPVPNASVMLSGEPPHMATSDAEGRFVFDSLPPRVYGIDARARSGQSPTTAVRVAADSDPVILRLETGSSLEVTAREAESGKPVARVEVTLEAGQRELVETTGERGTVRFDGITTSDNVLRLAAPGYVPMTAYVPLSGQPGTSARTLLLRRGVAIEGRVTGPDGAPVSGAGVRLDGGFRLAAFSVKATSGADGRWHIDAAAPGPYELRVEAPAFPPVTRAVEVAAGAEPFETELAAGLAIRGRVVAAGGEPVASATVRAADYEGFSRQAESDADGRFVIEGLPRGPVTLVAESYPATSATLKLALDGDEIAPVTLEIDEHCARGRVVDSRGVPAVGARVRASSEDVESAELWESLDRTDSRGRFALCRLEPGVDYAIAAVGPRVPSFFLRDGLQIKARARAGAEDLELRLEEPGSIVGRIAGHVPPRFGVSLSHDQSEAGAGVTIPFSETGGEFAVTAVPPGRYVVLVAAPGRVPAMVSDVEVRPGGAVEMAPVTLEGARHLSGRVVDAAGEPVAGATVVAGPGLSGDGSELSRAPEGGDVGEDPLGATFFDLPVTKSDAAGRFSLELPYERVMPMTVVADHARLGRSAPRDVAGASSVTLVLAETGSLGGHVDPGVEMVSLFAVDAAGKDLRVWYTAEPDDDGRYSFPKLAPGRYRAVATAGMDERPSHRAPGAVDVTIAAGSAARLDLDRPAPRPPWSAATLAALGARVEAVCRCRDWACRDRESEAIEGIFGGHAEPGGALEPRLDALMERRVSCLRAAGPR